MSTRAGIKNFIYGVYRKSKNVLKNILNRENEFFKKTVSPSEETLKLLRRK